MMTASPNDESLMAPRPHKILNVVIVNDTCEVDGGAALVALDDARALAAKGHRVIFFAACGKPPGDAPEIQWISLGQSSILHDPQRWRAAIWGLWNWKAARALKEVLRELPPDSTVVHLHSWSKALTGSVIAASHRAGFKIICTLHEYFVVCPNGGLYDYPTRKACALKPMSLSCVARNCDSRARPHKIWRVLRQLIWRHCGGLPAKIDLLLTVSEFSAQKISAQLGDRNILVLENLPQLHQQPLCPLAERHSIVFAGRVAAEKGVDVYLAACELADIQAEVWGDGPLLPQLQRIWPAAKFSGWLPKAELARRLRTATALVVPSLWYENSPLIIAEAAAAGVPVIVSDNGAAAELVSNNVSGLHFKVGDAVDLAEKMQIFAKNPALAFSIGRNVYEEFWKSYLDRRKLRQQKLEFFYNDILELID